MSNKGSLKINVYSGYPYTPAINTGYVYLLLIQEFTVAIISIIRGYLFTLLYISMCVPISREYLRSINKLSYSNIVHRLNLMKSLNYINLFSCCANFGIFST